MLSVTRWPGERPAPAPEGVLAHGHRLRHKLGRVAWLWSFTSSGGWLFLHVSRSTSLLEATWRYRYSGTSWPNMIMPPWFLDLTDEACPSLQRHAPQVCRACGVTERPNSCNANLYEDGAADRARMACDDLAALTQDEKDSVGWHADDEPCFDAKHSDVLIISLSLGAVAWPLGLLSKCRPDAHFCPSHAGRSRE